MGVLGMRIRAATEAVSGRVKTVIGKATGDRGLMASGMVSRVAGGLKGGAARGLGWTRAALQAGLGGTLRNFGRLTRSRDMQAVGAVKEVQGQAGRAAS
jgi:uncharacterized protein YjbJ (UPF0337 family)